MYRLSVAIWYTVGPNNRWCANVLSMPMLGRQHVGVSHTHRASPAAHSWLPSATQVLCGSTPASASDNSMAMVASIRGQLVIAGQRVRCAGPG
jgi:hypothetical protein